ncbi:MAG: alpha-galactosidase, partial [Clostridia bacterium]|nr:alpha-galactosidase [Clostridia bacterium]
MSILFDQSTNCFHLSNSRISYIFRLAGGKYPAHVHWGRRVRAVTDELIDRRTIWTEETFSLNETSLDFLPMECPTFAGDLREGMIHVIHESGMSALLLEYESHRVILGKPQLSGLPSARGEDAQSLLLTLRDKVSGVAVELCYTVYEDVDVIARSARIINGSKTPIVVDKALSACVDFEGCDMNLTTLSGAWVRERQLYTRPLVPGDQGTSSTRGASSVQTSPFMMLTSKDATETCGEAFGFALCYSGGFEASVHVDQHFISRAQIGIQPFNFSWRLLPGESFQTPEAYLCYSCEGIGGMSRNFHALVHRHITTGKYAHSTRPILINNWEATYFNFDEEKLLKLARVARRAGIDLFVLDDGWFGHRDDANSSLGDWYDDTRKLPGGLAGLSQKIHKLGLKFGLWIEPEMISVDSGLYKQHPEWCIHVPGYPRIEYRDQLVLDLSRDEVRDYVVDAIIAALKRGKVDYVKWDMNRFINMWGSAALPADRQQELGHRYILGVYDMMRRITGAFPDVLFESCAGGGGRFDLGMMCFMPQGWCSDDTDAWMRCRIQHATSLVFPPSTMGAHVS